MTQEAHAETPAVDDLADRVGLVLRAAEDAAAAMRAEAEELFAARLAEADREAADVLARAQQRADEQLTQARELARVLVERATELMRRLEDSDEVRRAVEGLAGEVADLSEQAGDGSPAQEPTPEAQNGDSRSAPAASQSGFEPAEEARLMALQMAMTGRTRGEVEADLRHGLGVEEPESILDDVFGKGTPPSERIPWSGVGR